MEGERKRSAGILARKPGNLNRHMRDAALQRGAVYKVSVAGETRPLTPPLSRKRERERTASRGPQCFHGGSLPPLPLAGEGRGEGSDWSGRHTAILRCRTGAPAVRLSAASMIALASRP